MPHRGEGIGKIVFCSVEIVDVGMVQLPVIFLGSYGNVATCVHSHTSHFERDTILKGKAKKLDSVLPLQNFHK